MKEPDDPMAIRIAGRRVNQRVVSHIQDASKNTGVSFSYLMAQASKESSFETAAGSKASSAAGLFQFTKGTWLQLVKTHGGAHGLADLASHIQHTAKGGYVVSDPKLRQEILDLRRDPQLSSLMAGEYAKDNKAWLERTLGRPVDSTDLYMAHFLGPGGAAKVLKAKAEDPTQPAAELLPQAAHLNPTVFYDGTRSPRSVAGVYERIHRAIEPPMKQYARLERAEEAHAAKTPAHSGRAAHASHAHVLARRDEAEWPFETGQWPPAHAVPAPEATAAPPPAAPEKVAYTEQGQSADEISAPMPPAPALPTEGLESNPLGRLFKNLFG
jgi:hypothetical protein